jgi:peptidoglycan hydrolase-like protein with peptidoglycan-binding domain
VATILKEGSHGPEVTELQALLKEGYYKGAVDASFGATTKAAVLKFQHDNKLVADGEVGPKTWQALLSGAPFVIWPEQPGVFLKEGSTGAKVKELQTVLNAKVQAGIIVDGNFGAKTKTALINYQKSNQLYQTGIVGPLTWGHVQRDKS